MNPKPVIVVSVMATIFGDDRDGHDDHDTRQTSVVIVASVVLVTSPSARPRTRLQMGIFRESEV
jgi:hypothetical protein